jgi:hypothetical protein
MIDAQVDKPATAAPRSRLVAFLLREWPYLLMLLLALFGVAYTSIAQQPMTGYWMVLAPFIGMMCVIARWQEVHGRDMHLRLVATQALHWLAVLLAMELLYVADVRRMMNADAMALSLLTVLALGTFTAGVHVAAWRICLVGIVLGAGVPAIAWLEQSTLLILLVVSVLAVIAILIWKFDPRDAGSDPKPTSA